MNVCGSWLLTIDIIIIIDDQHEARSLCCCSPLGLHSRSAEWWGPRLVGHFEEDCGYSWSPGPQTLQVSLRANHEPLESLFWNNNVIVMLSFIPLFKTSQWTEGWPGRFRPLPQSSLEANWILMKPLAKKHKAVDFCFLVLYLASSQLLVRWYNSSTNFSWWFCGCVDGFCLRQNVVAK